MTPPSPIDPLPKVWDPARPVGEMLQGFRGKHPRVDPSAYVHPTATLIGDVEIGPRASTSPAPLEGPGLTTRCPLRTRPCTRASASRRRASCA